MADPKEFSVATDVEVDFCDPQSSRQIETDENAIRLLRQYFPKQTDRSPYSRTELNRVALPLDR